jgi:caffeoyl-CoA O-methyltransferase
MRATLRMMFILLLLWQAAWMLNRTVLADEVDDKVQAFLDEGRSHWRDLNVPFSDGRLLHDLIIERGFKRGFEIGTSTGHSTVWIAWAMRKTGGRLITVEIDAERQAIAKRNIEQIGLGDYVEFLLGDAHELTPAQTGEFDFVFSDADKEWYVQYFKDLYPKLTANACFTAHNISNRWGRGWVKEYLDYVKSIPDMDTRVDSSGGGVAITCKR